MENDSAEGFRPAKEYTADAIKTLSSLEHIRQRPGMYIGRKGDGSQPEDGVYVLIKEVIDNSIDEFIMGCGRRIDISLRENIVMVRDYGRGIPLEKLVECVSQINTGAKYNSDVFQFSVGLNGVGTKAVNALSLKFVATAYREGKFRRAEFERGILVNDESGKTEERNGTLIEFIPDPEIFPKYTIHREHVERRLWLYAYLNSGLSLYLNNEFRFYSKNGLKDLVDNKIGGESLYDIIYFKNKTLEFAFTHTNDTTEKYYSFVNGQYTNDGGTHLSAFKEGLLRAVNTFSGKDYDARDLRDGIVGAIAIKLRDPVFESQTKNKLGNNDIRGEIVSAVKQAVEDYLHRHLDEANLLIEKIKKNETVRKEIQAVRTKGKKLEKSMSLRNSKLSDCKYHFGDPKFGDDTMIFLTEGDSAGGSLVSSRNPNTQAVYALRGKVFNCFGKKLETVYTVEELYYIMRTLDIEEDVDNLRYAKVVIATDADVDGLHIRNLLLTFFLTYFEPLVQRGHLYILETPLFRVRDKNARQEKKAPKKAAVKEEKPVVVKKGKKAALPEPEPPKVEEKKSIYYCYSEEERDQRAKEFGKSAEITRFKGLGEISPEEFGQFIGEDIRLEQVIVDQSRGIDEILRFYMGENTPERWEHIVNHLV